MTQDTKKTSKLTIRETLSQMMHRRSVFVGVDLHKEVLQLEVQSSRGEVLVNAAFTTDEVTVREIFSCLVGRVRRMTCEATGFWYWFADLCDEMKIPLVLANPRGLRVIADSVKKCDRLDAHWLCEFLRQGYIDEAAVPEREARDQREMMRTRQTIKRHAQDLKRQVRSFMMQYGLRTEARGPFCKKGIRELRAFELTPWPRKSLDHLLSVLESVRDELVAIDEAVDAMARENPLALYLQNEVPGIGPILSATILTEAMDVSRFRSDRKFAAHTGLVPKVRESAGRQSGGGITKHGPRHLRWALVQAARLVVANDPVVKKWYERHRRRKGASRAYVMVAHKLARYVYMFSVQGLCFEAQKLFPPASKKQAA